MTNDNGTLNVEVYEVTIWDDSEKGEVTLYLAIEEKGVPDLANAAKVAQGYWGYIISIRHLGDGLALLSSAQQRTSDK